MEAVAPSTQFRWTKKRLLFSTGLVAVTAVLVFLVLTTGLIEVVDSAVLRLRAVGPAAFFVAMALLPAVGFPMIAFSVAAGPVFVPALGTGWVIMSSISAVVANLLLTYWLANRALRPLASRLLTYFEFHLPDGVAENAWPMTLIVRLTPGPPFWAQSYLLGLIRVPLVPYLVVSTLVMAGYIVALVCGGEAIARSNGRLAVTAVAIVVVFVAAMQLLRKRTARRRAAAALLLGSTQPMLAK